MIERNYKKHSPQTEISTASKVVRLTPEHFHLIRLATYSP